METLGALAWPMERLGEAIETVARHAGVPMRQQETPTPPTELGRDGAADLGLWLETTATWLGLEAESVETPYAELAGLVRGAGPALLRLSGAGTPSFLALLRGTWRHATLLGPDLAVHRRPLAAVVAALCQPLTTSLQTDVERLLDAGRVPRRRRARVRTALLRQRLSTQRLGDCWLLRLPADASVWRHLRHAGVWQRLLALLSVHAVQYGLWLLSWWLIGQGPSKDVSTGDGCWPGPCSWAPWCPCVCS
jgi:ATP-binding cassette subfamily B protein